MGLANTVSAGDACLADVESKKNLARTFNLTIPEPAYRIAPAYFEGDYFKNIPCDELERLMNQKSKSYKSSPTALARLKAGHKDFADDSLATAAQKFIKESGVKTECYSVKAQFEMTCAAVANTAAIIGGGLGAKEALKTFLKASGEAAAASRALAAIERGVVDEKGRVVKLLENTGKLSEDGRKEVDRALIKKKFDRSHHAWSSQGRFPCP